MQPRIGTMTPWGAADYVKELAPGIFSVGTPSHGGMWVSPERLAQMPKALLLPATFYKTGQQWFEEDVEVARVILAFPEVFDTAARLAATQTLKTYHPETLSPVA